MLLFSAPPDVQKSAFILFGARYSIPLFPKVGQSSIAIDFTFTDRPSSMTDATSDPIELPGGVDALFPLTTTEDDESLSSQLNDLEPVFDPDCGDSWYSKADSPIHSDEIPPPRVILRAPPEEDSSDGDELEDDDEDWRPKPTSYNLRHRGTKTYKSVPTPTSRKKLTEKERRERRIASYRAYRLRKRKGLQSLEEEVAKLHEQVRFLAEATSTPLPLISPVPSMPSSPPRHRERRRPTVDPDFTPGEGTISTMLLQDKSASRLPPQHYRDLRARKKKYRSELEKHKEDLVGIVARLTGLMRCSPPLVKMDTTEDESPPTITDIYPLE